MANLTFSNLISEVFAHIGLDTTDSTNQANVARWINYVQQDLCSRWPWSFMLGRETIVTIIDKTGTVSLTGGATSLTLGTLAAVAGDIGSFIQFAGSNDWYLISNVASPFLTYTPAYQGSSATIDSTVRKFFYSLSSSADEIIDIRNWNTPVKLIQVDPRTLDAINPLVQSSGPSYGFMTYGYDSSGNLQLSPYPYPNDARLFEVRTKKRPIDMVVTTTETPSIPNKYAHILAWGAIAVGFAFLRKFGEAKEWNLKFEARVDQMKREYRQSEDYQPILGSIDSISRTRWVAMPSGYPVINS